MVARLTLAGCVMVALAQVALAQDPDRLFRAGAGYTLTERDESALNLWLQYQRAPVRTLEPRLVPLGTSAAELAEGRTTRAAFLRWSPLVDFRGGTDDTMGALIFEFHADIVNLPWSYPAGGDPRGAPDPAGSFTTWPISIGLESSRNLDSLGIVGEIAWHPVAAGTNDYRRFGLNPWFEIGLQGGYKAKLQTPDFTAGGDLDESQEPQNRWLLRAVGSAGFYLNLTKGRRPVTLNALFEGYWDVVNDDFYHRLSTELRAPIASFRNDNLLLYWDIFRYENGVGRPTFNEGQQLTSGLSAEF